MDWCFPEYGNDKSRNGGARVYDFSADVVFLAFIGQEY
jgi:hypothetical protein